MKQNNAQEHKPVHYSIKYSKTFNMTDNHQSVAYQFVPIKNRAHTIKTSIHSNHGWLCGSFL